MSDSATQAVQSLQAPYCYYAYAVSPTGPVDYMHYGYWEDDTQTIADAQENLAKFMKSYIPAGILRILDSGCGLGRTTFDLAKSGFDVVGISPDRSLLVEAQFKFPEIKDRFICSSFERFDTEKRFDMIYFQESSQYISAKALFDKSAALIEANGFVLICDEVRYSSKAKSFNHKSDMLRFASMNGFELVRNDVITTDVLPTRRRFTKILKDNIEDMVRVFGGTKRDVRAEVLELANGWDRETAFFESHDYGYEVFLFRKTRPPGISIPDILFTSTYAINRKWLRMRARLGWEM